MIERGDRVCCIVQFPVRDACPEEELPHLNRVYTVREVIDHRMGCLALRLVEIVNTIRPYNGREVETCFAAHGFRPVTDADVVLNGVLVPRSVSPAVALPG